MTDPTDPADRADTRDGRAEDAHDPDLRVFSYALSEKSPLYVAVLESMFAGKERFHLQLRPAEVALDVPGASEEEVATALERLETWGNLTRFYDTAAPETLDDFYAKRYLYQLTPAGIAAHQGVRTVLESGLHAGGRLSAVLLPGIVDRLEAIHLLAAEPDPAKLYSLFIELFGVFAELADNASRYMSDLAVETSTIAGDDDSFLNYKRAVFAYLDEFVARLADLVPRISSLLQAIEPDAPRLLVAAAAADLAPVTEGDDVGPLQSFEARWDGVCSWFLRSDDHPSVSDALRHAMLDALNRILVAVGRLNERHVRRVTREADFVQLARWFAVADDRSDHHQSAAALWDAAFGLYPARHFTELAGDEGVERGRSFWDAEPVAAAPRLRATGTRAAAGRPGRASDYSAVRRVRLAQLLAQHRQAEAAARRLAGRTPARLSDLAALDRDEFAQFLAVVDAALAVRPAADGTRRAVTPMVQVTLQPLEDGARASVTTADGVLTGPDHLLHVTVATARVAFVPHEREAAE